MNEKASPETLVAGTRGSLLARAQTRWVVDRLCAAHPGLEVEIRIIRTRGDKQPDRPLPEIGGKGLFTEELEAALTDGSIDIAVHSAKDLPTDLKEGLGVIAWPVRVDPRDAWISSDGSPFEEVPEGAAVGTTSLRRQAQLLLRRPDLTFVQLRGNVDTRIRKVHCGDCHGAVLAMAGLIRAGLADQVVHPFEPSAMLPAPGQGVLAIEGRNDDENVIRLLEAIHDTPTARAVECERAILARLDAGCRAPVAALATVEEHTLRCDALVLTPRGDRCVRATASGQADDGPAIVDQVVVSLKADGADEIIAACRST